MYPQLPPLKATDRNGRVLTGRERPAEHRASPACASCHNVMDPLGFALENYDAVGRWRTLDEGKPVDATGALADGTKFDGPGELREALLKRPELFVAAVTEKLLVYALGRGLEYYDAPAVRRVVPLLDATAPAATALAATAAKPIRRLGYVYIPMGADMSRWTPPGSGTLRELPPILSSLAPFVDHLTVITNLQIKNAYSPGNHATANCAFLSCAKAKMTEGSDYEPATTADQLAARQIGTDTPLPSLELAMDLLTTVGNCDNGYACVYQNNRSRASPTTPLPAEAHPRLVFERLFGEGASAAERQAELRRNASILDWVREDMDRLKRELGPADRARVGDYLEAVREVERRIQRAERQAAGGLQPDQDRPAGVRASYDEHARLMFDVQVPALQADMTRVITFQLAREAGTRV